MIERTLILLKPDAMQRGIIGEIITKFEKSGIKIVASKLTLANKELATKHYDKDDEWLEKVGAGAKKKFDTLGLHLDKSPIELGQMILDQLFDYITMSPVLAIIFEGHNVIDHVRKLVGATKPNEALPGTIRGDYSFDTMDLGNISNRPVQNLIHASDSKEAAEKEISLWFKPEEIHSWEKIDEVILYRGLQDKNNN